MANNMLLTNIRTLDLPAMNSLTETFNQVCDFLEKEIGQELLILNQQFLQDKHIPMQTVDAYIEDFI